MTIEEIYKALESRAQERGYNGYIQWEASDPMGAKGLTQDLWDAISDSSKGRTPASEAEN